MQRDLVVAAHGANGAAERGAQHRAERGRRALAAHGVVIGRAGARRSEAVRAQVARSAGEDGRHLSGAVLVAGVRRRLLGRLVRGVVARRLVRDFRVIIALALALGVVSGAALAPHAAVGRARAARPARSVTARRVAEGDAGRARLALSVLERLAIRAVGRCVLVVVVVARSSHAVTRRAFGAPRRRHGHGVVLAVHHWCRFVQHLNFKKKNLQNTELEEITEKRHEFN